MEDIPLPVEQYLKQLQASMKVAQEVAGNKDHKAKLIVEQGLPGWEKESSRVYLGAWHSCAMF